MPHEAPQNASRVTYAIGKIDVPCVTRFAEGHVMNEFEAAALNQLVQENTRNNLHQKWKREDDKGEGKSREERVAEAIEYQTNYQFGVRRSGRPTSVVKDPVRAEALNIMKRLITQQLAANKKPIKGRGEEILARAEALLDSEKPIALSVWEKAREAVARMKEAADSLAGELDDILSAEPAASETPAAAE